MPEWPSVALDCTDQHTTPDTSRMSTTQSVPATDASKAAMDATAQAIQPEASQRDTNGGSAGDKGEDSDEDEEDAGPPVADIDLDAPEASASASVSAPASTSTTAAKKKKKKSKGKGKALDKLKSVLPGGGGNSSASASKSATVTASDESMSVASGKDKQVPEISDAVFERIMQQARANLSAEEAAKLDRQSVMEMVQGEPLVPPRR